MSDKTITHRTAKVMLDSLDDYARMDTGVNAFGPRETLEKYIAQQETRITAIEAENARLRADAERYRWLKEKCGFGIRKNQVTELSVMLHTLPGSIHKLDDAIDAERGENR